MDSNGVEKAVDLGVNVTKILANLSEGTKNAQKKENQNHHPKETTNQPHNQTVEVKVGGEVNSGSQVPKIIREKPETHIHKVYPDARELSKDECDLERFRIEMEYKEKEAERQYRMIIAEHERRERKEREEYAHKMEELRREEHKKRNKRGRIIGGALLGFGLGLAGYCVYTDFRNSERNRLAIPTQNPQKKPKMIKAEGTVK